MWTIKRLSFYDHLTKLYTFSSHSLAGPTIVAAWPLGAVRSIHAARQKRFFFIVYIQNSEVVTCSFVPAFIVYHQSRAFEIVALSFFRRVQMDQMWTDSRFKIIRLPIVLLESSKEVQAIGGEICNLDNAVSIFMLAVTTPTICITAHCIPQVATVLLFMI